jgi:Transposase DDE domain
MHGFAWEALRRVPLAEAVVQLWRHVCDPVALTDIFERNRGACYTDTLTFPVVVNLVADALLEHEGSGRKSFERAQEHGELEVSIAAAYGKLGRLPMAVSEAFLAEATDRLAEVFPRRVAVTLPASVRSFDVMVLDGKAIKRVPKRLRPLRRLAGGVLGGKALVALQLSTGMAVAMATSPDGDTNEASLVSELLPQVQARHQAVLWLADRQFGDAVQAQAFTERPGDHFLIRYHIRTKFCADAARPQQTGQDAKGRSYVEEWGWLGAASNKKRRYIRRITLKRPGAEAIVLITDLLEGTDYPASDLLALYLMRWGIERVFQVITEVFHLKKLIGTRPQGTLFQLAFCLVLYNMIQVIRGYVAQAAKHDLAAVSIELLFDDVRRQLIALHEIVEAKQIVDLIPEALTVKKLKQHLQQLLANVWTDRWRKAPSKKHRPHEPKDPKRTHSSAYRILQHDRLARIKESRGGK